MIGVHLWGRTCDIDALTDIARRHDLKLLFDAAHAFACSYKGRMIGNFGEAEVFSFHATKFLNTFEGGTVATNNDDLAGKIRLMKNFGFMGYDNVGYIGTNGKMSEVSAAMGLTSLEHLSDFIATNLRNHRLYREGLHDVPGLRLISYDDNERCNYQYVVLEVDETASGLARDELKDLLWAENVLARRYFYPGCHRMEPYRSYFPNAYLLLPVTEQLSRKVLVLPTGTGVGPEDIETICHILRFAVANARAVRSSLAARHTAENWRPERPSEYALAETIAAGI
jgi:dTDP-4-amino-4,6-dideoxygalactose transaminase